MSKDWVSGIADWVALARGDEPPPLLVLEHQDLHVCQNVADRLGKMLQVPLTVSLDAARSPLGLGPLIAAHLRHLPLASAPEGTDPFPLATRYGPGTASELLAASAAPGWVFANSLDMLYQGFRDKLYGRILLKVSGLARADNLQLRKFATHDAVLPVFCATSKAEAVCGAGACADPDRGVILATLGISPEGEDPLAYLIREHTKLREEADRLRQEIDLLRRQLALHEARGVIG